MGLLKELSIQLYSVRTETEKGFAETLERIKNNWRLGYERN